MKNPVISYFIWNWNPEIFSLGGLTFRWSALLLVLAFLAGRQVLLNFYKNEPATLKQIANLPVFLVVVALIGARLGHLLIFEPAALIAKAHTIIFPFALKPDFHFLGRNEFSLHGGVVAILIFLFLYRGRKLGRQNYLQLLDRVSLAAAAIGVFVFVGSFLNSEIVGKQTRSVTGTVLMAPVAKGLMKVPCCIMRTPDGENPLEKVEVKGDPGASRSNSGHMPVILNLFFKQGASQQLAGEFLIGDVKTYLYDMSLFVYEPGTQPLHYSVLTEKNGTYRARISTLGVARHPVQVFEAVVCLALFVYFFRYRDKPGVPPGRIFGLVMVLFWTFEFIFGFIKEGQQPVSSVLN
ncbi:MAG TPA: prolipoprotein diacylglyceryl transferase family protein, partial [Chryseosolibacter sp.]